MVSAFFFCSYLFDEILSRRRSVCGHLIGVRRSVLYLCLSALPEPELVKRYSFWFSSALGLGQFCNHLLRDLFAGEAIYHLAYMCDKELLIVVKSIRTGRVLNPRNVNVSR